MPELRPLAAKLIEQAAAHGIDVILTCTYRSNEEQAALYRRGRTVPGPRVTNAKPGESLHNVIKDGKPCAHAFDIAIIEHGKCNWDACSEAWKVVGAIGEALGLEWGFRWRSFPECPHFQLRPT
jgi:peptidoglycan L-alanyl-D-glutamate endopeptidase CwlK